MDLASGVMNGKSMDDVLLEMKVSQGTSNLNFNKIAIFYHPSKIISETSNQLDYFKTTLDLLKQMEIEEVLESNGVVPSNSKTYDFEAIDKGFKAVTGGKRCAIKCTKDDLGLSRDFGHYIQYVNEVMCCLDKDFNFIDCPFGGSCEKSRRKIAYPKISN